MTFDEFLEQVSGHTPYPWQKIASNRLLQEEDIPFAFLPTASGKTTLLAAAVYSAAHGGRKRILFIVDRRLIVDEVYETALAIQHALAHQPQLAELNQALGGLQVVKLRGGVILDDDDWLLYPEKTSIIVCTIDQAGSRLLHRAYNTSSRKWSMHAGFVANNALWLLDEAHLAQPFCNTIKFCIEQGADIKLIQLSATPNMPIQPQALTLTKADLKHPSLSARLSCTKNAQLVETNKGKLISCFNELAIEKIESAKTSFALGIVTNRIKTARKLHSQLTKKLKKQAEVILLIGRVRGLGAEQLRTRYLHRIKAGRDRTQQNRPIVVIATQTVEVGANLDFDCLITEVASLSALEQRLGRLGREGLEAQYDAYIIADEVQVSLDKNGNIPSDPIYGTDIYYCWLWLNKHAKNQHINFGVNALGALLTKDPAPQEQHADHATLLTSHLHLLSQTGPMAPNINVASYLHGPKRNSLEVTVIWRSFQTTEYKDWVTELRLLPPQRGEAMSLPLPELRSHLNRAKEPVGSDLMTAINQNTNITSPAKYILRWCGKDDPRTQLITQNEAKPGDTLVLPIHYGGVDQFGWNFGDTTPATDIAESAYYFAFQNNNKVGFRQRLTESAMNNSPFIESSKTEAIDRKCKKFIKLLNFDEDKRDWAYEQQLNEAEKELYQTLKNALLFHPKTLNLEQMTSCDGNVRYLLLNAKPTLAELAGAISGGVAVSLEKHSQGVADMAAKISASHPENNTIIEAAKKHDLGKKYIKMQQVLHGSEVFTSYLAKSPACSYKTRQQLLSHFDMPKAFRHELYSLEFANNACALERYLIGTHHGYGRPWFPLCFDDTAPGQQHGKLGDNWQTMFSELIAKYGFWYLAEMELYLRAADIRQSIQEQVDAEELHDD